MFCMAKKSKSVKNCPLQREDYLLPQQSNFGFSSPRLLDPLYDYGPENMTPARGSKSYRVHSKSHPQGGRTTPDNAKVFFTLRTRCTAKVLQRLLSLSAEKHPPLGLADSTGTIYRRFLLGCGRFMMGSGRFLLGSCSVLLGSCSVLVVSGRFMF